MFDLNLSIRSGRLTSNPELKTADNGKQFVNFRIAVNRNSDSADFFNYTVWNETARFIDRYCRKGTKVIVLGSDRVIEYQDKNGNKKQQIESICKKIYFGENKASEQPPESVGEIPVPGQNDDDLPF